MLQGLPGIGGEKAMRLQNKFGSIEAVITADRQQLQTVEGIGDHIAVEDQISACGSDENFPI